MGLVYVGDATFMEKEPVDLVEHAPREWSPRKEMPKIYWYVEFTSLERAYYGLALLKKGPKSKWIDSERIGHQIFEAGTVAALTQFKEALGYLEKGDRFVFEEYPFVEVETQGEYNQALAAFQEGKALELDIKGKSSWTGPGVYDFRDMTRHSKSVEEYEKGGMEYWADETLEMAYDSDWERSLHELLERNL